MALLSSQPVYLPLPTLTNPDLILPYRSSSLSASSVTPGLSQQYSTRPRTKGRLGAAIHDDGNIKESMRKLFGNGVRLDRSGSDPVMPFMESRNREFKAGDYEFRQKSKERLFLTPSPTLDDEYGRASTISSRHSAINNGHWEGFDGPCEEVMPEQHQDRLQRSPQAKQTQRKESPARLNGVQEIRAILDEDEDDPHSHAAMSRRAEYILSNAKKRLLTMENNLSRARHGLNARPSSSMSSFASHKPEPTPLYVGPGRSDPHRLLASDPRRSNSVLVLGKGHTRVFSETSVPSSLNSQVGRSEYDPNSHEASSTLESASGELAQVQSVGAQSSDASRNWFWTGPIGPNRNGSTPGRLHKALEPLHEDEPAPASFNSSPFASNSPSLVNQDLQASEQPLPDATSSELGNSPVTLLTRARSTTQMRDLRDQMQDLKGKISTLKEKAREDSLRRRSLQSLRTPNPFTAAEQWYAGTSGHLPARPDRVVEAPEPRESTQIQAGETGKFPPEPGFTGTYEPGSGEPREISRPEEEVQTNATKKESNIVADPDRFLSESSSSCGSVTHVNLERLKMNVHISEISDPSDAYFEGFDPENGHINYRQEAEQEDIQQNAPLEQIFHESSSFPVGERHEDRPDAFDYEHFFLHSGMGHYDKADISRTSSHSSMYSVETTKPSNNVVEEPSEMNEDEYSTDPDGLVAGSHARPNIHLRQNSGGSVSTVGTFATATEGRESDDEDGWIIRRPMAGSWQPENPSKHKFKLNNHDTSLGSKQARGLRTETAHKQPQSMTYPARSSSLTTPAQMTQPSLSVPLPPSPSLGLLSTLSASTPTQGGVSAKALQLRDGDKDLVERLIRSLFNVCAHLHSENAEGERYESRIWRRKLDAARRILDGEVNGEAF